MRTAAHVLAGALLVAVVMLIAGFVYLKSTGLRGLPEPGAMETRVARVARSLAIPGDMKARSNPLAASDEALTKGLEHFAKYCAMHHGNNGGGGREAAIGKGLYQKPPDMRAGATQGLTDGELYYIIENGVRFTGMPAFGTGEYSDAGEEQTWQLVRFIRHLARITDEEIGEMEELNPL